MKTPMQEMYDQLKASRKDEYGLAFAIDMLLENEQAMLEKEKEAVCEFAERYLDSIPKEHPSIEDVYNETFNTKEK